MRSSTLGRRYAAALFEEAKRENAIDAVESDLALLKHSFETMPELRQVIDHPLIPADRKKKVASGIFEKRIQPLTLKFVSLLIDKRREELLMDVGGEFVHLANEFRSIQPVMVTSVIPLSSEEQSALSIKLQNFTGKKIELNLDQDDSLIGGMIIRIADTIIDGSVRGYLNDLRNRMLGKA